MAGDFAYRVDSAGHSRHDARCLKRAALLEATRSVRRKPVRNGSEPEERSAEDTAARPAPRSRRVDRAHGARLLAQGSEPHRIGVRGRRRVPSRREAGGRPQLEQGANHRKTSSRMGAPDRAGTVRIPTGNRNSPGRNEAPTGVAGRFRPTDRRQAVTTGGQGRGQDQPPLPMAASPYGSCGRWRALRSPEKLTGFRFGRLLGASSRPPGQVH